MTSFALCFLQAARALQFGAVIPPAALDLNKFAKQLPVAAIEVVRNGRALGIDAVASLPLFVG